MRKILFFFICTVAIFSNIYCQTITDLVKEFDEKKAWEKARSVSSKPKEQQEFFEAQKRRYYADLSIKKQSVEKKQTVNAQPNSFKQNINQASNSYCANADFSNANFTNWIGGTYSNSAGANWNTFTPAWTAGIVTMGNNIPAQSAVSYAASVPKPNRHTIMTIPPGYNIPPANCIGWDSITVNPSHVSDIPFVPPFATGGVTCRLGNANNDYETERLSYVLNVSSQNALFKYSYAAVLYDGTHAIGEQSFLSIKFTDSSGNLITGCGQNIIDATQVSSDSTFKRSSQYDATSSTWTDGYLSNGQPNPNWFYYVFYKKWTTVYVDLSAYIGQNVNVEFRTADCIFGGHWGYAYIYSDCGGYNQAAVNMCPGSTSQQIVAPSIFSSYQWYGPNVSTNAIPAGTGGTNDTLFISNGNSGDTYTVQCVSFTGCTITYTASLALSSVSITSVFSTPSCVSGYSGSAGVIASGSSVYNYQWTNSAGQSVGGNTSVITGIPTGTYSVHVSATGCGQKDTQVIVGTAPPISINQAKYYCGTKIFLTVPGGSSAVQWYDAAGVAVPSPQGNNDSLTVFNPVAGSVYSAVYNSSGCIDSLRIKLLPLTIGMGSFNHHVIKNVCIGFSNGQASITLNPASTGSVPYSYNIAGPGNYSFNSSTSQTTYTFSNLAPGTYTIDVFDGACFYNDQLKIDTLPVAVSVNVSPQILCFNDTSVINFSYSSPSYSSCQSVASSCGSPISYPVGIANATTTSTSYPSPFGNWYTKMKAQYIYTAAELQSAGLTSGKISSISFDVTAINGATAYSDFNISLGCTSQSGFSVTPTQNDLISGLVNVYSNPSYSIQIGANVFTFTQPYVWDGVSNIVIDVCFEMPGTSNYTLNSIVKCTNTTAYSSLTITSDTDPLCAGLSPTGFYSTQSAQIRPDAIFGWCPVIVTPQQFTYAWNTTTGLFPPKQPPVIHAQPATTTFYAVTITDTLTGCSKVDTFSVFVTSGSNISVSPSVLHFSAGGGSLPYNVCFNGTYAMSKSKPWLNITNTSGFGSASYTASVISNPGAQRIDTIHISSGILKQKIIVIQDSVFTVGVQNISRNKEVSIYPNPSNGKLVCHLSGFENRKLNLVVTDMLNSTLFTESFICKGGDGNKSISLENLADGVYFIRITTETEIIIKKIIIEK